MMGCEFNIDCLHKQGTRMAAPARASAHPACSKLAGSKSHFGPTTELLHMTLLQPSSVELRLWQGLASISSPACSAGRSRPGPCPVSAPGTSRPVGSSSGRRGCHTRRGQRGSSTRFLLFSSLPPSSCWHQPSAIHLGAQPDRCGQKHHVLLERGPSLAFSTRSAHTTLCLCM